MTNDELSKQVSALSDTVEGLSKTVLDLVEQNKALADGWGIVRQETNSLAADVAMLSDRPGSEVTSDSELIEWTRTVLEKYHANDRPQVIATDEPV